MKKVFSCIAGAMVVLLASTALAGGCPCFRREGSKWANCRVKKGAYFTSNYNTIMLCHICLGSGDFDAVSKLIDEGKVSIIPSSTSVIVEGKGLMPYFKVRIKETLKSIWVHCNDLGCDMQVKSP